MKRLFPHLALGWVFLSSLSAQDPGPSQDFTRMANQWMVSADAGKRKAAYRSWMQLAPETQPAYRKALEAAAKYHSKQLDALARGRTAATNPYAAHQELAKQLDEDRLRVMTLIKTDWKKDPGKIKTLRSDMAVSYTHLTLPTNREV